MKNSEEKHNNKLVNNFINSVDNNTQLYFDSVEMEIIIEELMQQLNFKYLSAAIEQAILQFPHDEQFRIFKVKKYILEFELDNAEKELEEIEKCFPPSADFYIEKVFLSNMKDKKLNAIKLLGKALALEPQDPDIHFLIGHEYIRKEDVQNAIHHVKLAFEIDVSISENLFTFSYLFEELEKPQLALEFYQSLSGSYPFVGPAWFGVGLALSWNNRFEEAIDAYEFALTCDGEFSTAHFNMGNSYFELKNYDAAIAQYLEAYRIDSSDYHSLTNVADCYAIQNWFEESLDYYQRALEINLNCHEAILGTVNALAQLNKLEVARVFVEEKMEKFALQYELFFAIIPFFLDDDQQFLIHKLVELTENQLDEPVKFFAFLAQFSINFNQISLGISILEEQTTKEKYPEMDISPLFYYFAALYYLDKKNEKGAAFLQDALLIDYEGHEAFLTLVTDLEDKGEIFGFIDIYKK